MIRLDLESRIPIYEQLKAKISELVLSEELKGGDQLPSVRSFARELGINPNTVQKAYQELERDGIIFSVSGRGNYISTSEDLISKLLKNEEDSFFQAAREAKNAGVSVKNAHTIVDKAYGEEV